MLIKFVKFPFVSDNRQFSRRGRLQLEHAVDRNRGIDRQKPAQRQAEDANQAAIGIVDGIDHETDRERWRNGALPRRPRETSRERS